MDRLRPSWHPGFLVPLVLSVTLVADLALRTLPRDRVSVRVWEALRTFGADTPFRPRARFERARVYGNLALLGNLPRLRVNRPIRFTTDSLGYHNSPDLAASGRVSALLFGSSVSAAAEVSDGEDLAAQLTALGAAVVYNAAPGEPAPVRARALARQVGMDGGIVIFEHFEGRDVPPLVAVMPHPGESRCRRKLGVWDTPGACRALTWWIDHTEVSPLQVFAARLHRLLEDDRVLPNAGRTQVIRTRLRNGTEVLFSAHERYMFHQDRSLDQPERYIAWLANRLALQGQRLLVVLAPQKYTVYAPLLAEPDPGPGRPEYFAQLERRLRTRGIAVVNLTEPLRAAARDALAEDSLVYWRDDTHWNPAGHAVSARAIAPVLVNLRGPAAGSAAR